MNMEAKAAPPAATGVTAAHGTGIATEPERTTSITQTERAVKNYGPTGTSILSLLGSGRGAARKRRELLVLCGLPDRVFRKGVEGLRRAGVVICADEKGYYLPETVVEVQAFIHQESSRAKSTFYTLQSAKQLAEKMQAAAQGEQIEVEGVR